MENIFFLIFMWCKNNIYVHLVYEYVWRNTNKYLYLHCIRKVYQPQENMYFIFERWFFRCWYNVKKIFSIYRDVCIWTHNSLLGKYYFRRSYNFPYKIIGEYNNVLFIFVLNICVYLLYLILDLSIYTYIIFYACMCVLGTLQHMEKYKLFQVFQYIKTVVNITAHKHHQNVPTLYP